MNTELLKLFNDAERDLADVFRRIDDVSFANTKKVMDAFREERVSDACFASSSGYGYDDRGRETLDRVYARAFGCESAIVRPHIVNGTQALVIGLFGLLRAGDTLLSVTGKPYDTLDDAIGISQNKGYGSLVEYGIKYKQVELDGDIASALDDSVKVVFIQRSKGYADRRTLTVAEINKIVDFVHANSNAYVMVDNCYGEFAETEEPRADLFAGSLIKNPGGGMAECGGYLAGSAKAVELASYRLTTPGVGGEVGASLGQNKNMFRGFFFAPHVVAQAIKTAHLAAYIFDKMGYEVEPKWTESRSDIIQAIKFRDPDLLCAFCRGIQFGSPVDAFVTPEPWDMPGYDDQVIMAAGTFVQGASIELSADGPIRDPYIAFMQGGLTYESGKIGVLSAAEEVLKIRNE